MHEYIFSVLQLGNWVSSELGKRARSVYHVIQKYLSYDTLSA